jgi:hypothetical protein
VAGFRRINPPQTFSASPAAASLAKARRAVAGESDSRAQTSGTLNSPISSSSSKISRLRSVVRIKLVKIKQIQPGQTARTPKIMRKSTFIVKINHNLTIK